MVPSLNAWTRTLPCLNSMLILLRKIPTTKYNKYKYTNTNTNTNTNTQIQRQVGTFFYYPLSILCWYKHSSENSDDGPKANLQTSQVTNLAICWLQHPMENSNGDILPFSTNLKLFQIFTISTYFVLLTAPNILNLLMSNIHQKTRIFKFPKEKLLLRSYSSGKLTKAK